MVDKTKVGERRQASWPAMPGCTAAAAGPGEVVRRARQERRQIGFTDEGARHRRRRLALTDGWS